MQTLRKKTSPLKYKNETTRFLGDGVSFKAKLIGILEVSEARGDRMCQEALSDLKMAIRAAGEHKQRIVINIAIDGLRLRDEKTGDSLYHHPVHKISFIAQDMTDSRAFGYIFGSPDIGHRFFGIKTDKAASQVVIAMRDLFQVVFALKKKEIELAKQHLDKGRFGTSPLFSDSTVSSKAALSTTKTSTGDSKPGSSTDNPKSGGTAVADLVDLELELNSLQQGLNQMERITPSDPFGDSFTSYTKPILPPPPSSGRERSSRTSETSSLFSPRTPHTASLDSRGDWSGSIFEEEKLAPEPTKDERHEIAKKEIMSQFDVFTELDPLELKNPPKKALNDLVQHQESFKSKGDFATDPFGDAPFDDPFAGSDPFDDFEGKTKIFNASPKPFAANFDKQSRLMQLHENPSLDVSSESECAPEPPPRPLPQAKPPPLPPKKQNDLSVKPPPRPPHVEESIYDYMDMYETAPNSLEHDPAPTPPLPVPARKSKFESDFVPERPRKFNVQSSEEDYLTPISLPDRLLPPPHKKKNLEKPSADLPPSSLEGLDITLSQLTLSGLNELANRLNLPTNQLSNMTLAQLTSFLSNFMKAPTLDNSEFKPDFAANFGDVRGETYDRYAVFRELINEEAKAEPEADANVNRPEDDKYAALREIVESEMKKTEDSNENVVSELIEYSAPLEKVPSPVKVLKSPVPSAVSEIVNSARLTSGSLSDVVSGSSPEVDNTASNSDKKAADAAGESWAIFDQSNALPEVVKEKQAVQSEEGVSPWSSDSKEFGNSSPPEWRQGNSGSDDYPRRRGRRDQEGWWDTSAEPEVQYHPANRRSTDSYEEEYYECYERPRRRKHVHGGQSGAGGHSSSSRDVSPWEEEPRRRAGWGRHPRFEKHRDRRLTDSWDDEDDYEYEEDHVSRFHRHAREYPTREHDWPEDRRPRRRREADRWCCPDSEHDRYPRRNPDWRYYNRESQESWEDDYSNEADDSPHFLTAKKNWKRPSSASEMGEKSLGENRRYRGGRRSRSRDSQLPEPNRVPHRTKHSNAEITLKSATLTGRKRVKDPPKTEESLTFPRKSRGRSLFENDFVPPEASPRLNFEAPAPKAKPRSPFEDDFSPDKPPEGSIKEEEDSFSVKHTTNVRKKKFRLNGADNLKKSESVNIFAQESDPFDDDFFSEEQARGRDVSTRTTDLKWSDEFGDYDKK